MLMATILFNPDRKMTLPLVCYRFDLILLLLMELNRSFHVLSEGAIFHSLPFS